MFLSGWGNYRKDICLPLRPEKYHDLKPLENHSIPRGLGRSYGDAAINSQKTVIFMERLDRLLAFDEKNGILRAEAGVSLKTILDVFVSKKWFPPVTPGSQYVTLGGCLASDVHGKNHLHAGTFSRYVIDIELVMPDGSRHRCSPEDKADLFWGTVGGMGLTGIISEVSLQLTPIETAYFVNQYTEAANVDSLLDKLEELAPTSPYIVAWMDCLSRGTGWGRGGVMTGRHASAADVQTLKNTVQIPKPKPSSIPFIMPFTVLRTWNVKVFNSWFYQILKRTKTPFLCDYHDFFYCLDSVLHWNLLYGRKGFVQFHCVLPINQARSGIHEMMELMQKSNYPCLLGVLKRFGPQGLGWLSFPKEGISVAFDFPAIDDGISVFMRKMEEIVLKYQGRVYLAKDSHMAPETFRLMYPKFSQWCALKTQIDPHNLLSSNLSRRLRMEQV